VFKVAELSHGHPLEAVAMAAMHALGLVEELALNTHKLRACLRAVEKQYLGNAYHNSTHAADVVQSAVCVVLVDGLKDCLTPLELLALVVAALMHDLGHQGACRARARARGGAVSCCGVSRRVASRRVVGCCARGPLLCLLLLRGSASMHGAPDVRPAHNARHTRRQASPTTSTSARAPSGP
jgi:hypothetical protein